MEIVQRCERSTASTKTKFLSYIFEQWRISVSNALYFPFISVPENAWFTRILLYWDKVGSIIPFEFVERPDLLTKFTQDLLTNELLIQIHPGSHVNRAPRFRDAFVEFIESLPADQIDQRRTTFRNNDTSRVHTEKMQDIADYLIEAGLAKKVNWSWCDVESKSAKEFMTYLAALLGQLEDVRCTPVTDAASHLDPFLLASQVTGRIEARLAPIRTIVLERLLPVPEHSVKPSKISTFKLKYGRELSSFRRSIEYELSAIADMTNPELQTYRLKNFVEEKQAEVKQITAYLSEERIGNIQFSDVSAIIAAIPVVNTVFGLARALYSALSGHSQRSVSGPLLYAAYVQKELG